jgi:hypothetical protein
MATRVTVGNLKDGVGGRVCSADITIEIGGKESAWVPLVTILGCSLFRGRDGAKWLGVPQRSWEGQGGTKNYANQVELPTHTYKAALSALQAKWEECQPAQQKASEPEGADPFQEQQ